MGVPGQIRDRYICGLPYWVLVVRTYGYNWRPSHSFIPSPSTQPAELLLATLFRTHLLRECRTLGTYQGAYAIYSIFPHMRLSNTHTST